MFVGNVGKEKGSGITFKRKSSTKFKTVWFWVGICVFSVWVTDFSCQKESFEKRGGTFRQEEKEKCLKREFYRR